MNRFKRFFLKKYYEFLCRFDLTKYKRKYPMYLKKIGINIPIDYYASGHGYIDPSVVFDANDYSLITIGKATTISAGVVFLTHDYSISKGLKLIDPSMSGRFLHPIVVGSNSFVGMRSILLPGTKLGDNVIVGAGSVVKGEFPDNVVVAGNPAKVICSVEVWARRHYELQDFELI